MTVPVHGLPFVLREGLTAVPVPPALKGPRSLVVSSCEDGDTGQLVAFAGVGSLSVAEALVGRTLLVREADLPEGLALRDAARLMGRAVADEATGALGTIEEVMRGPANDVWVVRGERGEVLVPAVADLVVSLPEEGPIVVSLPRGLVGEGA